MSGLLLAQTAKEHQLYDFRAPLIFLSQPLQRLIKREQIVQRHRSRFIALQIIMERYLLGSASALLALARSSVVDEHLAHRFSGEAEEMLPILPVHLIVINQPEKSFVDQRRRLQRVPTTFFAHLAPRDSAQFVVNQRHKLL